MKCDLPGLHLLTWRLWTPGVIHPPYQSHTNSSSNLTSAFHSSVSSTVVGSRRGSMRIDEITSAYSETDNGQRSNESQMFPDVVTGDSASQKQIHYSKVRNTITFT